MLQLPWMQGPLDGSATQVLELPQMSVLSEPPHWYSVVQGCPKVAGAMQVALLRSDEGTQMSPVPQEFPPLPNDGMQAAPDAPIG